MKTTAPAPALDNQTIPLNEPANDDRRAAVRFACSLETACQPVAEAMADSWPARVLDISAGGVALNLYRRFEPRTMLAIRLESADENVSRSLFLRVVHVTPEVDGSWRLGCALAGELGDEELRAFKAERVRADESDCRAWVRFACDVETSCRPLKSDRSEAWSGRILDVSAGGLSLLVPSKFERGALLEVDLPAEAGQTVRAVTVRVVRERTLGSHLWLLGCEFADGLSAEDLAKLT